MNWRLPATLALLFLGAAAAPPNPCGTGPAIPTMPAPTDLSGRSVGDPGLSGQNYATLPLDQGGCESPLSAAAQSTNLKNEEGDVLHGLPSPELVRPAEETHRAPEYR